MSNLSINPKYMQVSNYGLRLAIELRYREDMNPYTYAKDIYNMRHYPGGVPHISNKAISQAMLIDGMKASARQVTDQL